MVNIINASIFSPTEFTRFFLALLFTACLSGAIPAIAVSAELTATVDRNTLGLDETFRLTVRYDGQAFSEPDFSALTKDFEVLGRNQQSQLNFTNGKRKSYTLWLMQLMPKRSGKLLIPSFNYKKAVSNAIEVTVSDQPATKSQSDQLVYMETHIDKQQAHVQEQLIVSHRLYSRVNLNGLGNEALKVDDATLVKLSEEQYQKTIDGVPHLVVETRYAVFPQSSGTLIIPSIRYSVTIPERNDPFSSSLFSRGGKKIYLRTDQQQITIKPRPANIAMSDWLPSGGISLSEKWSRPPNELRVGEPVTRTISMTAQGLTAAQLPPLELPAGDGFRVYPDQPQLEDSTETSGVIGTRTESLAIVPDQAGSITLPEVTIHWWDSKSRQQRTTKIAEQTLQVLPAAGASAATATPAATETASQPVASPETGQPADSRTTSTSPQWLLWSLVASNSVLLALLIWQGLRFRRLIASPVDALASANDRANDEKQLFKTLRASATDLDKADIVSFRENLFNWARLFWQDSSVSTYENISTRTGSSQLAALFSKLDQSSYGEATQALDADTLKQIVMHLDEARKASRTSAKTSGNNLKPLYETSV